MTVSGRDRELNAHFYSAASLKCQVPDNLLDTDTGATSPSPTPKIREPSGEQLVPLLTTLVCRGPGSNRSRSVHSTYCATITCKSI